MMPFVCKTFAQHKVRNRSTIELLLDDTKHLGYF